MSVPNPTLDPTIRKAMDEAWKERENKRRERARHDAEKIDRVKQKIIEKAEKAGVLEELEISDYGILREYTRQSLVEDAEKEGCKVRNMME